MIEKPLTEILADKNAPAGSQFKALSETLTSDIKIGFNNPDIYVDLSEIETSGKVIVEGYNNLTLKGLVSRGYNGNAVVIGDGDGLDWDGCNIFDAGGAGCKINASFTEGGQKNIRFTNWWVDECGGPNGQSDNFAIHRGGHFTENVIVRNLISTNAKVEEELDITTEFARNILFEGGEFAKVNIGHGAQAHLKETKISGRLIVKSSEGVIIEGGEIASIILTKQGGGVQAGGVPRNISISRIHEPVVNNQAGVEITWIEEGEPVPTPEPEPDPVPVPDPEPNPDPVPTETEVKAAKYDRIVVLVDQINAIINE